MKKNYKPYLKSMEEEVRDTIAVEDCWRIVDACLYNGGTALMLLLTALATYLKPTVAWEWLPRIFTGLTTFLIALDRALGFGPRWKHHIDMVARLRALLARILSFHGVPEKKQPVEYLALRKEISEVYRHSASLPTGSNGAAATEPAGSKK
jgi:hypothetical protein